jgi:hypothetical protein
MRRSVLPQFEHYSATWNSIVRPPRTEPPSFKYSLCRTRSEHVAQRVADFETLPVGKIGRNRLRISRLGGRDAPLTGCGNIDGSANALFRVNGRERVPPLCAAVFGGPSRQGLFPGPIGFELPRLVRPKKRGRPTTKQGKIAVQDEARRSAQKLLLTCCMDRRRFTANQHVVEPQLSYKTKSRRF